MSSSTIQTQQQTKKDWKPALRSFGIGVGKAAGGTFLAFTMLASSVAAGGILGLAMSFRNLPDVRSVLGYVPKQTSYIYDIKGKLLARLHGEENREIVKLSDVSPELKRAVLAIEDSHFYQHQGINLYSMGRAFVSNWKHGEVVEGASTITMQLVKNLLLSPERVYSRKLSEVVLAIRLEQVLPKDTVFEMYLNNIYWGHNNYGVKTAAETYFNKSPEDINLAEAAMMAGLIQAPEKYSPFINYQETKRRQALVLSRMKNLGWISPAEESAALKEPLLVGKPTSWSHSDSPYITEAVVQELNDTFGREYVLQGGMRVQTTIDYDFQQMAEEVVRNGHRRLHRWGLYVDQVALVSVDPRTHFVKAMVGGVDFKNSQFNRVTQAKRQPGSAFKPFVYYTAFASGKYTPESSIEDTPVTYRIVSGTYSPKNYDKSFYGKMSVRKALLLSRNVPAIKIGQEVGLDNAIKVTRSLGIDSPLQPVISLPLGSMGITPLEMTAAYATFASNGWHSEPTLIVRVTDSQGNLLLENTPKPKLVLNEWATASLTSVLQGVIESGTGRAAKLDRPAAGKTGTTSDERDVWFVGYVPQLATAVWIGNDDYRPLGKGMTGGGHAAPIWREFMVQALKNEPVKYFHSPSKFERPAAPKKSRKSRRSRRYNR
ncbi:MAG: penicillin-binding protein 1A [Prochloraceae cyanobacterium]|nr:penicillin-binding protein 1A [Prochloraceae cyanobacterium]